jgi:Rrf2 family protein
VRGAQGGYMLALSPELITVGAILTTLEGPLAPTDCVVEDDADAQCDQALYCVTKVIYEKIYESISNVVNAITLQHMLEDYEVNHTQSLVHNICECK